MYIWPMTEERRGGSARLYMAQWDSRRVDVIGFGVIFVFDDCVVL